MTDFPVADAKRPTPAAGGSSETGPAGMTSKAAAVVAGGNWDLQGGWLVSRPISSPDGQWKGTETSEAPEQVPSRALLNDGVWHPSADGGFDSWTQDRTGIHHYHVQATSGPSKAAAVQDPSKPNAGDVFSVTKKGVNVHAGPELEAGITAVFMPGTEVRATGELRTDHAGNKLIEVEAGHRKGWVLARLLTTVSQADRGPENLAAVKQRLKAYQAGDYKRDVTEVIEKARAHIAEQLAKKVPNPTLVLDIDETSLSNYEEIEHNDGAYFSKGDCTLEPGAACGVPAWEKSARAKAIGPTLELFKYAREHGVAVTFITGRPDDPEERAATMKNLAATGYEGWSGLIMKPAGASDTGSFKTNERRKLVEAGNTIVACVGDQWSDGEGGYVGKFFKVPNPWYYIPSHANPDPAQRHLN